MPYKIKCYVILLGSIIYALISIDSQAAQAGPIDWKMDSLQGKHADKNSDLSKTNMNGGVLSLANSSKHRSKKPNKKKSKKVKIKNWDPVSVFGFSAAVVGMGLIIAATVGQFYLLLFSIGSALTILSFFMLRKGLKRTFRAGLKGGGFAYFGFLFWGVGALIAAITGILELSQ